MTNHRRPRVTKILLTGAVVIAMALTGCSSDEEGTPSSTTSGASDAPQVSDVWARAAMAGSNTAIYFVVDGGSSQDRLVSVSVPDGTGSATEIHETVPADEDTSMHAGDDESMTDDADGMGDADHGAGDSDGSKMMTMRPVDGVDVPAGGQVTFEPGGFHVMVMDLNDALAGGDQLPVTLTFERAGDISVTAEVREP